MRLMCLGGAPSQEVMGILSLTTTTEERGDLSNSTRCDNTGGEYQGEGWDQKKRSTDPCLPSVAQAGLEGSLRLTRPRCCAFADYKVSQKEREGCTRLWGGNAPLERSRRDEYMRVLDRRGDPEDSIFTKEIDLSFGINSITICPKKRPLKLPDAVVHMNFAAANITRSGGSTAGNRPYRHV